MAKKKEKECTCGVHRCGPRCLHAHIFILGVLILLNAYYAWFNWAVFTGGIIALKGLIGLIIPHCPYCG